MDDIVTALNMAIEELEKETNQQAKRGESVGALKLEDLCGEHIISGVEFGEEKIDFGLGAEECSVLLFTLDGVTYKLIENPDDGYRSYCEDVCISDREPKFTFPGVKVLCSMVDSHREDCIVMRDMANEKVILKAGTLWHDAWYPCCCFKWTPENMAVNGA